MVYFIIGMITGATISLFLYALVVLSSRADELIEK